MNKKFISFKEAFERAGLPYRGFYENSCNREWDPGFKKNFSEAGVYFVESISCMFNRNRRVNRTPFIYK